jgi:replicative DNA helicase
MYLVGAAMMVENAVSAIFSTIRHWHFYFEDNKVIWKAITRLYRKEKAVTKDLVYMELQKIAYFEKKIDPGYLLQCVELLTMNGKMKTNKAALACHQEIVFEMWSRRQLIDLGSTMQFWGFLPGGHTAKMLQLFEKRKERIGQAYEHSNNLDNIADFQYDPLALVEKEDYTLTYTADGVTNGIAEQGCIVTVSGASGSRKTTTLLGLISSAFLDRSVIGFKLDRRGTILFFDTEQPKKRFQHTQRRLYDMCRGANVEDKFKAYRLREKEPKERVHFINKVIRANKGDIAMIVIDGILDLVQDMNNLKEASSCIQMLMSWTEETKAIMVPVLHDAGPSSGKMLGHLGGFLSRKQDAEINVNLAEDANWSNVVFRKTRAGRRPRPFEFTQNEFGYPVLASKMIQEDINDFSDVPF